MDPTFKLVVGETYTNGKGERHKCVGRDLVEGWYFCDGEDTTGCVFNQDGTLILSEEVDDLRLRPIPE